MPENRKKPVPTQELPEEAVTKVVRQISIIECDSMAELEQAVNNFLPKLNYNDITEPATEIYYFDGKYYAKTEYDLRIKKPK